MRSLKSASRDGRTSGHQAKNSPDHLFACAQTPTSLSLFIPGGSRALPDVAKDNLRGGRYVSYTRAIVHSMTERQGSIVHPKLVRSDNCVGPYRQE